MDIVFHDGPEYETLKPLTWTRPVADLRIGTLTISQKWLKILKAKNFSFSTANHLKIKFPEKRGDLHLRGGLLPCQELIQAINSLKDGEILVSGEDWLAHRNGEKRIAYSGVYRLLKRPENIFLWNKEQLEFDFDLLNE